MWVISSQVKLNYLKFFMKPFQFSKLKPFWAVITYVIGLKSLEDSSSGIIEKVVCRSVAGEMRDIASTSSPRIPPQYRVIRILRTCRMYI